MKLLVFLLVVAITTKDVCGQGLGIRLVIGKPKHKPKPPLQKQIPTPVVLSSPDPQPIVELRPIVAPVPVVPASSHYDGTQNQRQRQESDDTILTSQTLHNAQILQGEVVNADEQLTQSSEQDGTIYIERSYHPLPVTPSKLKMTNITSSLSEKFELPYGQRTTIGMTFPLFQVVDYNKVQRPASVGSLVSDTFIIKEYKLGNSFAHHYHRKDSVLNGILQNMMQDDIPAEAAYPADLIKQEVPLDGNFHHYGVTNLTKFLLDLSYKTSESKYFVALQLQHLDRFAKEDMKIHVVLGDKHLTYTEIQKLDSLYAYVNRGVYDDPVKNSVRSSDVDNIRDFVYYVKDIHYDLVESSREKANQVYRAHAKDSIYDGWAQDYNRDIFTWPYVNTIAYRTL